MKWRLLVWAAAVIAVGGAVGMGADAVIAGIGRASALAGLIAGFCELAAFALGVAGWAGQRRAATLAGAGASTGTQDAGQGMPGGAQAPGVAEAISPGSAEAVGQARYVVDVRGAQGVQVGDGGMQRNDFGVPSPGDGTAGSPDGS